MLYLGIDIAKNTHVATLINAQAKHLFTGFSFPNTIEGGESLIAKLSGHISSPLDVEIGMEATGHYWLSLYSFLDDKGYTIYVINPIQTDSWRRGIEIRKRKTDKIDSFLIANLLRFGEFVETSLSDENIMSLRNLSRFRHYLIGAIGNLKRKAICILDQIFPEYQTVFSDMFGQTSTELLKHFQSADDFASITAKQLEKALDDVTLKAFAKNKLMQITKLASKSFGLKFCRDSFSFQLRLLIGQIRFIEAQVFDVETEIKTLLEKINSPITTVPGVGAVTGAAILSEIGDIRRFPNPSKLVAFSGIDATVIQSGESSCTYKMSKRGSPYLRKALFQAALVASIHDPVFKGYYQKKRAEGKHHLTAVGAVARKLCYTIHSILKNNTPYVAQN